MKVLGTFILAIMASFQINCQVNVVWSNIIGGSAFETSYAITQANDGGYLIAGNSFSDDMSNVNNFGASDIILIKADEGGQIDWIQNYGGSNSDSSFDIISSTEGGCLIVGGSESNDNQISTNNGSSDILILKVDNQGALQWQETIGDVLWDEARQVIQGSDGNYYVLSRTQKSELNEDYKLTKLDQSGNILWDKEYGGSANDYPSKIIEVESGFIIVGSSESSDFDVFGNNGEFDFWVFKIDLTGNILWNTTMGGSMSEVATDAIIKQDGNLLVIGRTFSNDFQISNNHGFSDHWLVEINPSGVLVAEQNFGGTDFENPTQIVEDEMENLLISGYSRSDDINVNSNIGSHDFWFLRINAAWEMLNSFSYGGSASDRLNSIMIADDKIIVSGQTSSDDGDIGTNNGQSDFWFGELDITSSLDTPGKNGALKVFPNPLINNSISIQLPDNEDLIEATIYNLQGQKMASYFSLNPTIDLLSFNAATYILKVKTNKTNYTQILIVN